MSKNLPIPEEEQLSALTLGLKEVYGLLSEYLGDLNTVPNFFQHITVTRQQLAGYLRNHPKLVAEHLSAGSANRYHENPIVEQEADKFCVYEIYRNDKRYRREFENVEDAIAEYLMWDFPR